MDFANFTGDRIYIYIYVYIYMIQLYLERMQCNEMFNQQHDSWECLKMGFYTYIYIHIYIHISSICVYLYRDNDDKRVNSGVFSIFSIRPMI